MKKILITGANFSNKGAQSMLFTTVDAIKRSNCESVIYFATKEKYEEEKFQFERVHYSVSAQKVALSNNPMYEVIKSSLKDVVKLITGRRENLWQFMNLRKLMPEMDLVIDISGFLLGKKWSVACQEVFLDNIRLAKKYDIPIIIMPQSFGPFDYPEDKSFLLDEINELLRYPDIIFAREKDGYRWLTEKFGLKNVQLSSDMVLQYKGVDPEHIYSEKISLDLPKVESNAVGVVPNKQCFTHGKSEIVLEKYKVIIEELLDGNREVYVFHHSNEDVSVCRLIYNMFKDNEHVHLIDNDFSCIEYDEFVKKFQFIVCSRFHGVVHAYRNGIPCIILGWAVKYSELADSVKQAQFVLDIVNEDVDNDYLRSLVIKMSQNYYIESPIIKMQVGLIQQESCLDCLKNYLQY